MRQRIFLGFALTFGFLMGGCQETELSPQAERTLRRADSVDAFRISAEQVDASTPHTFHGYPIEQHVTVTDPQLRHQLVQAVRSGTYHLAGLEIAPACRFHPHHALRVIADGVTVDYVMCFRCAQGEAYLPDGKVNGFFAGGATARDAFVAVLGPDPDQAK